jgi:hypothetical protein
VGASAKPIIVGGSLLAAVYTVANALALYCAKAYLIDRPALTVDIEVEQIGPTEDDAPWWSRWRFENNGVPPYDLTLKGLKPITHRQGHGQPRWEPSYRFLKQISLPSVYPDGQSVGIDDINGIICSPGERGKNAGGAGAGALFHRNSMPWLPPLAERGVPLEQDRQRDAGAELAVGQWLRLR